MLLLVGTMILLQPFAARLLAADAPVLNAHITASGRLQITWPQGDRHWILESANDPRTAGSPVNADLVNQAGLFWSVELPMDAHAQFFWLRSSSAPIVTSLQPVTSEPRPEWTWTSGGWGNEIYRYQLNSDGFASDYTECARRRESGGKLAV